MSYPELFKALARAREELEESREALVCLRARDATIVHHLAKTCIDEPTHPRLEDAVERCRATSKYAPVAMLISFALRMRNNRIGRHVMVWRRDLEPLLLLADSALATAVAVEHARS